MKFRPLHDRVVVRRIEEDMKTAGGIIIPDTAKEKPMQGEVIAVGPGVRDESGKLVPLDVKKGDRVLFGKWSGSGGQDRWRRAGHHERERYFRGDRGKMIGPCRRRIANARKRAHSPPAAMTGEGKAPSKSSPKSSAC